MKTYSLFDAPIKVYGVPFFEKEQRLARLPETLMDELKSLSFMGKRCPGGRLAFKTDSKTFKVKVYLKTLSVDIGMSIYACQSAHIMVGERENARHIGVVNPSDYNQKVFEKTFEKSSDLEQVTIYFPRNEEIENIEISIEDDAVITEPTPYKYQKPIVFYGSSITEGGCCCNVTNSYIAILSRWLDFDFINMGFSGAARGEKAMADYINTIDMGAFVYDYDHNAPNVEELMQTHKPFFDRIREAHPNIPIIMMTRPAEVYTDEFKARREVVKATYNSAIGNGDKNVYFIDGEVFFGEKDRNLCAVDNIHPNDIGFLRMAKVIRPVLEKALINTK